MTKKMDRKTLDHLNSHGSNLSRRQFIGLGLATATSTVAIPSIFTLFTRNAFAKAGLNSSIPYIGFDLAGGAAMPGNFLVGGKGGPLDLLPSYDRIGWNPKVDGFDSRFGLPMPKANISKVFEGMTTTMSEGAQKNFRLGSFAHVGRDDTSDNPLSIIELLTSIPETGGSKSRKGLGQTSSSSGGNSRGVKAIPQFSPSKISSILDVTNLTQLSPVLDPVPEKLKKNMFETMRRLSALQTKNLLGTDVMPESVKSSFDGVDSIVGGNVKLDPREVAETQKIYGINTNTVPTDITGIRAGIAHCVISKVTGPGVITIGGCDYHDGTQTTGDAKDLEIGREIGRAVELAHQFKTPLFVHIYTDGAVGAATGTRRWGSDSGDQSMTIIGYYDPKGPAKYRSNNMQIGQYTPGQGADRDSLIGQSSSLVAYAVLANYMNLSGSLGDFNNYAPNPFTSAELDSVLIFDK